MGKAVRQSETTTGDDWLPIDEAASLTGDSLRTLRWRAKGEANDARRQGRQSQAHKAPPRGGKGKPTWWLHRSIDPRLTRYPTRNKREDSARSALVLKYPQHHVELAYRKAHWLDQWQRACERRRGPSASETEIAERVIAEARQVEGEGFPIGVRSLQLWRRAYSAIGDDGRIRGVEALIDRRSVANQPDADSRTGSATRSPQAIDVFYGLFHTESQGTVETCHANTLQEARAKGWAWPTSTSATRKWLDLRDDVSVSFLLRCGKDAWCRRYMPHLEIDYTLIQPGQMFQTDHHECDFWVEHAGKQLRPWLTVVQDMRSRAIVGWNLGPVPHSDAIIAAYLMAFRDWAIPEVLRIDNGRHFTSRVLTGVTKATRNRLRRELGSDWQRVLKRDADLVECVDPRFLGITNELEIKSIYAIPYSPWSKGTTERWFSTFEAQCGKGFATYCGRSAAAKPECLEAIRQRGDVPTMEEARADIADYLVEYHHRAHSADDMAGRSPLDVWQTATRLRRADEDSLALLMEARGCFKVGPNGVAFKVGGTRLTYGAGNPALYRYAGRDVFITLDPTDSRPSHCYAFTADRSRFIARLESNKRISPMATTEELREANAQVGRSRKAMHKAGRDSPARTQSAVDVLREKRRERVAALRKTGTDDVAPMPNVTPVRTGFEGSSRVAKTAASAPKIDRRARDLSAAKAALGATLSLSTKPRGRRRASDDLLRGRPVETEGAVKDDGDDEGTDAGTRPTDAFSLIAGADRHERTQT